ncbi:MAG: hypothetical protein FWD57_11080 [Polyangiaceae bacterium]|nr:hypothetical protein [Polyangiaceae bacterium]
MNEYLIRGTSIEDTNGWKATFAEATTPNAAAFLVETEEGTPVVVLLGNWHQVSGPNAVQYQSAPDDSCRLGAAAHVQHMIVHLTLPEILSTHLGPTRIRTDDGFEWCEIPFVHDSPLRYLVTAAAVLVERSAIRWKLNLRGGWCLEIDGIVDRSSGICSVGGRLVKDGRIISASDSRDLCDKNTIVPTTESAAVWPNPDSVPSSWKFFSFRSQKMLFTITEVDETQVDPGHLVARCIERSTRDTGVCNTVVNRTGTTVYFWTGILDSESAHSHVQRLLIPRSEPPQNLPPQNLGIKIDLGVSTTAVLFEEQGTTRPLDFGNQSPRAVKALVNYRTDLIPANWIPCCFGHGPRVTTIRTGLLRYIPAHSTIPDPEKWWIEIFFNEFLATPSAMTALSEDPGVEFLLDKGLYACGETGSSSDAARRAFESFVRMLLIYAFVDACTASGGASCRIVLSVTRPNTDIPLRLAYERTIEACATSVARIVGLPEPTLLFLDMLSVDASAGIASVVQRNPQQHGLFGLLCVDLGAGSLDISASYIDQRPRPNMLFAASFDFGTDRCFHMPHILQRASCDPTHANRAQASDFQRVLDRSLPSEVYNSGTLESDALVVYHAALSHLVMTYAQALRANLFEQHGDVRVHIALFGDGWLWFPQDRPILPYNRPLRPMFARSPNTDEVFEVNPRDGNRNVNPDGFAQTLWKLMQHEVHDAPIESVAYIDKLTALRSASAFASYDAPVRHPVGLCLQTADRDCEAWYQYSAERSKVSYLPLARRLHSPAETTPTAADKAISEDYGVFVQSGPWSHLDPRSRAFQRVIPIKFASRGENPLDQDTGFTSATPDSIQNLLMGWQQWVSESHQNPDSFLVYLISQICEALRDRN